MVNTQKLNTFEFFFEITYTTKPSNEPIFGLALLRGDAKIFADASKLGAPRAYLLKCSLTIRLYNRAYSGIGFQDPASYGPYPILFRSYMRLDYLKGGLWIIDYHPKTLNSAVNVSRNTSDSSAQSSDQQYSSGSSQSQTNSYGGSVNFGFTGDVPGGGVSANFEHSSTTGTEHSHQYGSSRSMEAQVGGSQSFTVKDWGAYGHMPRGIIGDNTTWQATEFFWGQEYPWNILCFRAKDSSGNVVLPTFVQERMQDKKTNMVLPPSEISMFGANLVCYTTWIVAPDYTIPDAENVRIRLGLSGMEASHSLSGNDVTASLTFYGFDEPNVPQIDIVELALETLSTRPPGHAGVNLRSGSYDIAPTPSNIFLMLSDTNQLKVTGTGFNAPGTTDFSATAVWVEIAFKILEDQETVTLYLKHWTSGSKAVNLTFTINPNTSYTKSFTRQINFGRTDGLEKNVTAITLRDRDYFSDEFCDFLRGGLNTIHIDIAPDKPGPGNGYELVGISVA